MSALKPAELLHEGKAKKVFRTNCPGVVAVQYKDDATAFNAQKKAQLAGKGLLNWEISARLFEALEADGIASHYLGCLAPGWMAVKEVAIVSDWKNTGGIGGSKAGQPPVSRIRRR